MIKHLFKSKTMYKLEQLKWLFWIYPHRPIITHTIDQSKLQI